MATTGVAFTIADIMAIDSMVAQATTTAEAGVTATAKFVAGAGTGTFEEVITAGATFTEGVAITEAADSTADVGNDECAVGLWSEL